MDTPEIVVGVDDSMEAHRAVSWAAGEAMSHGLPLRLVNVVPRWAYELPDSGRYASVGKWVREDAARVLEEARQVACGVDADITVTCEVMPGEPWPALREAARNAEILVVGSRGSGGFGEMLVGSVAIAAASRALCSVVVVRGAANTELPERIVVGVDFTPPDSPTEGDLRLLDFGLAEAAAHGSELQVVAAWDWPFDPSRWLRSRGADAASLAEHEEERLRERIAGLTERAAARCPTVPMTWIVNRGHPVDVLVRASGEASLLVVGRHRVNPLTGLPLGSAARGVLHHALCPVAVIPVAERSPR